jgi:hypothetical protein
MIIRPKSWLTRKLVGMAVRLRFSRNLKNADVGVGFRTFSPMPLREFSLQAWLCGSNCSATLFENAYAPDRKVDRQRLSAKCSESSLHQLVNDVLRIDEAKILRGRGRVHSVIKWEVFTLSSNGEMLWLSWSLDNQASAIAEFRKTRESIEKFTHAIFPDRKIK